MMGYGPEEKSAVLELTYNYGVTEYEKGNAYAQVHSLLLVHFLHDTDLVITLLLKFEAIIGSS